VSGDGALADLANLLPETIKTFVVSILALYIVVNPSGVAAVFLGLTRKSTSHERQVIALRSSITAALILTFFALAGTYILGQLRVTGGALQIAGGIFIFGLAYALARGKENEYFGATSSEAVQAGVLHGVAYSPLAVPMMAGPASITIVMTTSAKAGRDPYAWAALLVAIAVTCASCLLSMQLWTRYAERHGPGFSSVTPRIMGLVLGVIAVQFVIDGIAQVIPHLVQVLHETPLPAG
jgi:multiple antibiotic resistance protein